MSGLNFDVLGYLDPQITIVCIENGHVTKKLRPDQPKRLVNVIRCTNPRCITAMEEGCDHIFALTPSGRYRCVYCEQEFSAGAGGWKQIRRNKQRFINTQQIRRKTGPFPGGSHAGGNGSCFFVVGCDRTGALRFSPFTRRLRGPVRSR